MPRCANDIQIKSLVNQSRTVSQCACVAMALNNRLSIHCVHEEAPRFTIQHSRYPVGMYEYAENIARAQTHNISLS